MYILSNTFSDINLYSNRNQDFDFRTVNYIFPDFIPYQESKTSIGINMYYGIKRELYGLEDVNYSRQVSFLLNNWFTNNLYINGCISPTVDSTDMQLKYNLSIGYAYNIDYKIFKNIVFALGYNRNRFGNDNSIIQSTLQSTYMSYNLLFNMKFKPFWVSFAYGVIDYDHKIENFSINFLNPISDSLILTFGFKYIFINDKKNEYGNGNGNITSDDALITPSLSLRYKI